MCPRGYSAALRAVRRVVVTSGADHDIPASNKVNSRKVKGAAPKVAERDREQ
eukprot:gene25339-23896_t